MISRPLRRRRWRKDTNNHLACSQGSIRRHSCTPPTKRCKLCPGNTRLFAICRWWRCKQLLGLASSRAGTPLSRSSPSAVSTTQPEQHGQLVAAHCFMQDKHDDDILTTKKSCLQSATCTQSAFSFGATLADSPQPVAQSGQLRRPKHRVSQCRGHRRQFRAGTLR